MMFLQICIFLSFAGASNEQNMEITVEKNDKLITIGKRYLESPGRWRDVAKSNRLAAPYTIFAGQKLIIPIALLKGSPLDAQVSFIKGDVQVRTKDSEMWKTLQLNERISQGDTIKTGDASTAEFTFEDSAQVLLRPHTALEVKTSAQKGGLHFIREFMQRAGRTISRLKAATGNESRFTIHTPSAVAAARGTEFRISVDPLDTTRTEVLQGTIGVDAKGVEVAVREGEGTLIRKNRPPLGPRKLLLPPSSLLIEPLYRTMPLVFDFTQDPGLLSRRIMLARDREMRDVIVDDVFKPDQAVRIFSVEDGSYFMQAQSIDPDGIEGMPSEPVSIRVRTNPLPPFIEAPNDGAEIRGKEVSIKWLKVSGAVRYHIQIAEDKECKAIVGEEKAVEGNGYKTQPLAYRTYYFRVSSIAEDGYEGVWSDTLSFTLVPPPPAPPLEQPQVDEKEIHMRWRNLGEGISYHFQMAREPDFRNILLDRTLDKAEITLQKPDKAGTYYVRISGIDATGYEGNFSPSQSFDIRKKTPYGILGVVGTLGVILLLLL